MLFLRPQGLTYDKSKTPGDVPSVLLGISLVFQPCGEKTREFAWLACTLYSLWLCCCYGVATETGDSGAILNSSPLSLMLDCGNSTPYRPLVHTDTHTRAHTHNHLL